MQNITMTQMSPGSIIAQRDSEDIAYLTLDRRLGSPTEGLWEARPVHNALTVGRDFPTFKTRREAVDYVASNY